jgi:hypothetical protein
MESTGLDLDDELRDQSDDVPIVVDAAPRRMPSGTLAPPLDDL